MILCVDKLSKRGTELLCFSKTRELWSSIAFFAAVHHLSGPFRKQNFTYTGSKHSRPQSHSA